MGGTAAAAAAAAAAVAVAAVAAVALFLTNSPLPIALFFDMLFMCKT